MKCFIWESAQTVFSQGNKPTMLYLNTIALHNLIREETFWFSSSLEHHGYPLPDSIHKKLNTKLPSTLKTTGSTKLYTTFSNPTEGFTEVQLQYDEKTQDFFTYFYHYSLHKALKSDPDITIHGNFLSEVKVYVKQAKDSSTHQDKYDVFALTIQKNTQNGHQLRIRYKGNTFILHQDVATIISAIKPIHIKELKIDKYICPRTAFLNSGISVMDEVYPVLNRKLEQDLDLKSIENPPFSYKRTWQKLNEFYQKHLSHLSIVKTEVSRDLPWTPISNNETSKATNLWHPHSPTSLPKNWNRKLVEQEMCDHRKTRVFFIVHKNTPWTTKQLFSWLMEGLPQLDKHLQLLLQADKRMEIRYHCHKKVFNEVNEILRNKYLRRDTQYIAVMVSTYSLSQKIPRAMESKLKGLLLDKRMIPHNMHVPDQYPYPMPGVLWVRNENLALKLSKRRWYMNGEKSNDLVIGIAGVQNDQQVKLLGFSFYCARLGKFHYLSTLRMNEAHLVGGKLRVLIKYCSDRNGKPEKVTIHLYENIPQETLERIKKEVQSVDLKIDLILISIKKRSWKSELAFDPEKADSIPEQGTFCHLGEHQFLLFNHEAFNNTKVQQRPPLKLCFWSNNKNTVKYTETMQHLMNQVYTLSHMHSDAIQNKDLPLTLYLPRKLAKTVAHFNDPYLPNFGRDKLWFI